MTTTRLRFLVATSVIAALLAAAPSASAQVPRFPAPPQPSRETSTILTVDPVAYLSSFVPYVEVTGTLSCAEGTTITVIVDIRQRTKGKEIGTVGMEDFSCSSGAWSMLLRSDAGEIGGPQFKPGKAEVVAGTFICDAEGCTVEEVRATIRVAPR